MRAEIIIKIDGKIIFDFHRKSDTLSWNRLRELNKEQIVINQISETVVLTIQQVAT